MDNRKIAKELVRIAKKIVVENWEDSPEDIAETLWSLMVHKRIDMNDAAKIIGYDKLLNKYSRLSDLPDYFDDLHIDKDKEKWIKAVSIAIKKAIKRSPKDVK